MKLLTTYYRYDKYEINISYDEEEKTIYYDFWFYIPLSSNLQNELDDIKEELNRYVFSYSKYIKKSKPIDIDLAFKFKNEDDFNRFLLENG